MNIYVDFDDCLCETGRPSRAYDASREWLNQHGLEKVNLYCLNKYGRDNFIKGSSFNMELEDYYKMHFDLAVEDSPSASTLKLKYEDALAEYEKCRCTSLGRLVANREIPVLKRAKELLSQGN
ncbi:MAG: hypothetical protein PUC37_06170 [Spirochaetales bacterium]|nr:hypothetical protein [Spirochaetales bacterium]